MTKEYEDESGNQAIARAVQELRKQLGVTQEQLAAHLGVSVRTISRWEQAQVGPRGPQKAALATLAKAAERAATSVVGDKTSLLALLVPFGAVGIAAVAANAAWRAGKLPRLVLEIVETAQGDGLTLDELQRAIEEVWSSASKEK